jgi:hypothetical protein
LLATFLKSKKQLYASCVWEEWYGIGLGKGTIKNEVKKTLHSYGTNLCIFIVLIHKNAGKNRTKL